MKPALKLFLITILVSGPVFSDANTGPELAGISAALAPVPKGVLVNEVSPGGPADKAGIHAGDIITKVDGTPVQGLPLEQVVSKIKGPVGSHASLTVQNSSGAVNVIDVVRQKILITPSQAKFEKVVADLQAEGQGGGMPYQSVMASLKAFGNGSDMDAYSPTCVSYCHGPMRSRPAFSNACSYLEEKAKETGLDKFPPGDIYGIQQYEYHKDFEGELKQINADLAQHGSNVLLEKRKQKIEAELSQQKTAAKQKAIASQKAAADMRAKEQAQEAAEQAKFQQLREKDEATQAALDAKAKTPACRSSRALLSYCSDQRAIRLMELQIAQEKSIGEETGVVDKVALHSAASNKIALKQQAEADAQAYKDASGKSASVSDCKLEGDQFPNVRIAAPLNDQVKAACGTSGQ